MNEHEVNEQKITDFLLYLENQSEQDFKKWLTGVNIFEILGITSAEIRHSRILAWLLDPKENHKLRTRFLEKLLFKVIEKNESVTEVSSINALLWDFSDGYVYRESKNNIDILFSSEKNKFNLVIENKTFTSDHDNQLSKYRTFIEKEYPGCKNLFVYLTPYGVKPTQASLEEISHWRLLSYSDISEILSDLISELPDDDKVRFIIKEYDDNIRRNILKDDELKKLSADIYFKYKEVLDLIINNKPNVYELIRESFINVLSELNNEGKVVYDGNHDDRGLLRFRTPQLDRYLNNVVTEDSGWGGSLYYYEIDQWKSLPVRDIQVKLSVVNSTHFASEEQIKKINQFTHGKFYKGNKISNDPNSYNTDHKFLKLNLDFEDIFVNNMEIILKDFLEENLKIIKSFENSLIKTDEGALHP